MNPIHGKEPAQQKDLTFSDAWAQLLESSPDLKVEQSKILSAKAKYTRADLLTPSNPELDLNYTRGNRQLSRVYSTDPLSLVQKDRMDLNGYELGISQELEISGQRSLRKKIAAMEVDQARYRYRSRVHALHGLLRESYYGKSALEDVVEHLEEHVQHLQWLRSRLGRNFRDPRLGTYVGTALSADLMQLKAEKNNVSLRLIEYDLQLKKLLGLNASAKLTTQPLSTFPFPQLPPLEEISRDARDSHPGLMAAKQGLEGAEFSLDLEERKSYPNPTFYLYGGNQVAGNSSLSPGIVGPQSEKETYFRAGMSIPLPLVDSNQSGKEMARADLVKKEANYNKILLTYESEIASAYRSYNEQIKLLSEMKSILKRLENNRTSLANALLRRRISYFEFWSEHERWHGLLTAYHNKTLAALQSLAKLETLTARSFTGEPLKIPEPDED